jgi:hypothetical protein
VLVRSCNFDAMDACQSTGLIGRYLELLCYRN